MSSFRVGHQVYLASNSGITFEIIGINLDQTFEIQVKDSDSDSLKFDHVSAEMLQLVDMSKTVNCE